MSSHNRTSSYHGGGSERHIHTRREGPPVSNARFWGERVEYRRERVEVDAGNLHTRSDHESFRYARTPRTGPSDPLPSFTGLLSREEDSRAQARLPERSRSHRSSHRDTETSEFSRQRLPGGEWTGWESRQSRDTQADRSSQRVQEETASEAHPSRSSYSQTRPSESRPRSSTSHAPRSESTVRPPPYASSAHEAAERSSQRSHSTHQSRNTFARSDASNPRVQSWVREASEAHPANEHSYSQIRPSESGPSASHARRSDSTRRPTEEGAYREHDRRSRREQGESSHRRSHSTHQGLSRRPTEEGPYREHDRRSSTQQEESRRTAGTSQLQNLFEDWKAACDAFFQVPRPIGAPGRFPKPPHLGFCVDAVCQAQTARPFCVHSVRRLLEAGDELNTSSLRRNRLRFHPDRYSTPEMRPFQGAAEELFKIFGTLIEERRTTR